ncbi:hypothetical protein NGA_0705200, partial [Nannochloropsis gaditana CCMP526]|uniref:uncharacterized protein n=1 Tax=Nannochloropsis gaditana (strain CCMP526) TaxID=1093141 RepID=UPI00029F4EA3
LVQNIACAYATLSPFTAVLFLGLGPAVWCRSLSFGDRAWKGDPQGPSPDPRVTSILTNLVPAHTRVDLLMGAPSTDGSGHRDGSRRETRDSSLPDRPRGRRTGGKEEGREQGGKGPRGAAGRGGHAGVTERAAEGESGRKDRTSGRSGKKRRDNDRVAKAESHGEEKERSSRTGGRRGGHRERQKAVAERGEEGKKWKQGEGMRKKRRGGEKEKRGGKRGEEGPRRVKLVLRRLPGGLTDEELRELLEEIVVKAGLLPSAQAAAPPDPEASVKVTATTGISLPGEEAGSEVEKEQTGPSEPGGVSVGKEGGREGG